MFQLEVKVILDAVGVDIDGDVLECELVVEYDTGPRLRFLDGSSGGGL